MLYRLLGWVAGVALDWFYAGIEVVGAEGVPRGVPLLVVANHPNQLVDALLAGGVRPLDEPEAPLPVAARRVPSAA